MARDDERMHGHNTPGMVPGRGHEHAEEPVRLGEREPGSEAPKPVGDAAIPRDAGSSTEDREEESALGGHTATRSGTAPTPDDEKA